MTCRKVEKALPLFVGGLDPARMSEVAAHLAARERCRGLHAELAAGRAFLEVSPARPLRGGLRRAAPRVGAGSRRTAGIRPRSRGRLILASAGPWPWPSRRSSSCTPGPRSRRAPGRTGAAPREEPAVAALPAASREEPLPTPAPALSVAASPRKANQPARRGPESRVVRIEFQTANPDVRIIWLVKKGEAAPAAAPAGRNQEVS
jgi:hypothetical protein